MSYNHPEKCNDCASSEKCEIHNPSESVETLPTSNPGIDFQKYLTMGEMQNIARRVFTEKAETYFDEVVHNRYGWKEGVTPNQSFVDAMLFTIGQIILDRHGKENMFLTENIMERILEEANRDFSIEENYDDRLRSQINYKLQTLVEKIIAERENEITPIIFEKIKQSTDKMLLSAFLSDLIKHFNFDKAINEVLGNMAKGYVEESNGIV